MKTCSHPTHLEVHSTAASPKPLSNYRETLIQPLLDVEDTLELDHEPPIILRQIIPEVRLQHWSYHVSSMNEMTFA
jgi:hypothetical protein